MALDQGFVSVAFTFHRVPGEAGVAFRVTFLAQIFHTLKSNRPTALQHQVITTLQLGGLVTLVISTHQRQISTRGDLTAHVSDLGDLIMLGLLFPPTALLLFVVQRVITVLRSQHTKMLTRHQISFITRTDLTRDKGHVLPSTHRHITTGADRATDLFDVVFLSRNLLRLVIGVAFVGPGGDSHVPHRIQRNITISVDLAGDSVEILPGVHDDIAPGVHIRPKLGDGASAPATGIGALLLRRDNIGVPTSIDPGVTTADHDAANVVEVLADPHGQVVGSLYTCGIVRVVLSLVVTSVADRCGGHGALVGHIPCDRIHVDVAAGDDPAGFIDDVIARQHVETIACFDQPAVGDVLASGRGQVLSGP